MNDLPQIVSRHNLRHCWKYRDEEKNVFALVARYDDAKGKAKKMFRQYSVCDDGQWVDRAPTPLPLYGLDTLPKIDCAQKVYIFEGEKCTTAAHHLELPALTSMMGSSQASYADWAILAKHRHIKEVILIPDNDAPGHKYMKTIFAELQRVCPNTTISVCQLPAKDKADDLVDWIQSQTSCPNGWDGFSPIDEPYANYLRMALEAHVNQHSIEARQYFEEQVDVPPAFKCDPEPIEEVLTKILPCPLETLPIEVVKWIQGFALQMQVSEDYLAAPLLVYLGSLIGRKRGLRLRQGTDWIEYPNLWGMLIGRPSMMKSPAMNAMRRPLLALAERAFKKYQTAMEQHELALEAWRINKKAREEVRKKDVKKAIEASNSYTISPKYQIENAPKMPIRKRYKTEDSTTEKLGELLIDNPQGLLIFRDELAGWLSSFNKPGRENDRQFFLESWSGNQDFDVDRIGRGSLHIPALCLSIFGSIQPGPLSQYIRSAVKGGIGDDGFIQRFQIMVWPDAQPDWELVNGISIPELEIPIYQIFDCLDSLTFDPADQPIILDFSSEAQKLFDCWQESYEKRLRAGNLPPHMEAHLTKYKKLLPAICLILEHLKEAINDVHPTTITAKTLEAAINWLDYFESHACRIYGSSANAIQKTANELIERLRAGEIKEPFTVRDVYYGRHWSGLANTEQVEEVLEYLEEKHYLVSKSVKTDGRPKQMFWVNPKIFDESYKTKGPKGPEDPF